MAALTIDWVGALAVPPYKALVTVPQDYDHMTVITAGVLYELDTVAFWRDLKALEESEVGIVFSDLQAHNEDYTVAGTTYADAVFMLCEVQFEDKGPSNVYTVQLAGSNNDIWDIGGGILIPQPNVVVSPGNSAGLVVVETLSASLEAKIDLVLAGQTLTNEQARAERTTQASVAPLTPVAGKIVLRDTVSLRRWEADAWEDENQAVGYRGKGLEKAGQLVEVAWS